MAPRHESTTTTTDTSTKCISRKCSVYVGPNSSEKSHLIGNTVGILPVTRSQTVFIITYVSGSSPWWLNINSIGKIRWVAMGWMVH